MLFFSHLPPLAVIDFRAKSGLLQESLMASSSSSAPAFSSSALCTVLVENEEVGPPENYMVLRLRASEAEAKEETKRQTSE